MGRAGHRWRLRREICARTAEQQLRVQGQGIFSCSVNCLWVGYGHGVLGRYNLNSRFLFFHQVAPRTAVRCAAVVVCSVYLFFWGGEGELQERWGICLARPGRAREGGGIPFGPAADMRTDTLGCLDFVLFFTLLSCLKKTPSRCGWTHNGPSGKQ